MATEWFRLSLVDGQLEPLNKAPPDQKPLHWLERDLENLLALNSTFLDVADHLPLRLRGIRGTVTSPDQAFVDELGRVVVVEVKRITAGLRVIAQAISYADHWRLLPPGEIDGGLRCLATAQGRAEVFGQCLSEMRSWAAGNCDTEVEEESSSALGGRVMERLSPGWAVGAVAPIRSYFREHFGDDRPPCNGAPARIVAVAPGFSDECIDFAEELAQRMVAVELVQINVVTSRGRIFVGREWVHREPQCEPTWRALRRAWRARSIRDGFSVNGWADALNSKSFSLSAREVADARLWFSASESVGQVWTVVPDGWYKGIGDRRKVLREQFLDALPLDVDRSARWLEWKFTLPQEQEAMDECVLAVAKAVSSVLVPGAPE